MSDQITLKDVEMAIKILEEYLKHVHKARSVLQRYHSIAGQGIRRAEDIIAEVIARDMISRTSIARGLGGREEEEVEEAGVDVEKAVERLRQLAESEKKKMETSKQSS